jgi:hypothetical protein
MNEIEWVARCNMPRFAVSAEREPAGAGQNPALRRVSLTQAKGTGRWKFVRSEAPAIANFSESRHHNRVEHSLFRASCGDRLCQSVPRAHFEHDVAEIIRLTN